MESDRQHRSRISLAGVGAIVLFLILGRSGSTILTPLWIDALNNNTDSNKSACSFPETVHRVDPFSMLLIANIIFSAVFGVIIVVTKLFCSKAITEHETGYDKKEFALVGFTEAFSAIMFLFASSGCRTAPYLQSIAANFSIPITFFLRFLILRKRPTCRKLSCAFLVLVAEVTALLPDIFPDLESLKAKKEDGGASGIAGLLWPICYAMGFVPLAICSIVTEKIMKSKNPSRSRGDDRDGTSSISTAYVLFWCYFFSLLSQTVLFWADLIPGFGMTNGVVEFARLLWFNLKCFIGYEGCQGYINYVSSACIAAVALNRITVAYFVKYLEGANLMAMILTIPTPLVFLFYTLFDENPLKWHPHAYLSTWLSIVALCIIIPAIYIYNTGPAEVDYNRSDDNNSNAAEEERRPLLGTQGFYDDNMNYSGSVSVSTQASFTVDNAVQTSPTIEQSHVQMRDNRPSQQRPNLGTGPFIRERRVNSDAAWPRRQMERRYTTGGAGSHQMIYSSSWHAQDHNTTASPLRDHELFGDGSGRVSEENLGYTAGQQERELGVRTPNNDSISAEKPRPFWTDSDLNDAHTQRQAAGTHPSIAAGSQPSTFGTSPFVECDTQNQSAVIYNGYREPEEMVNPFDESRAPEAASQSTVSANSPPPSYTSVADS